MNQISAAMQAVLNTGGPFVVADCYTITLADGTVLRWTTAQRDLPIGGTTWNSFPHIEREKVTWRLGLQVDTLNITITDDGSQQINGMPLVQAVLKGLFDRASIVVERFLSDSWSNTAPGTMHRFTGNVGDASIEDGHKIKISIESKLAELRATFPRTYILPSCSNTLFDGVCGLVKATYTSAGSVGAGATATQFTLTGVSQADDYYALGTVKFTSGANAGAIRQVKSYKAGVITFLSPVYSVPQAGDTVEVTAGCDKTRAVCTARFNNLAHFRGFPYVPDPATQYAGGGTESSGSGGSLGPNVPRSARGEYGNVQPK